MLLNAHFKNERNTDLGKTRLFNNSCSFFPGGVDGVMGLVEGVGELVGSKMGVVIVAVVHVDE